MWLSGGCLGVVTIVPKNRAKNERTARRFHNKFTLRSAVNRAKKRTHSIAAGLKYVNGFSLLLRANEWNVGKIQILPDKTLGKQMVMV